MGKLIDNVGYLGNFSPGDQILFWYPVCDKNGASVAKTTPGSYAVYKGNDDTQHTSDISNGSVVTGLYSIQIVTSVATSFYVASYDYKLVLTGAVVDGETVNAVLCTFSLDNRA